MSQDEGGWIATAVTRTGDMSPDGRLQVVIQKDGDVILRVVPPKAEMELKTVEFCSLFCGGGRSPNTIKALYQLVEAMKLDNANSPIPHSGDGLI